MILNLTQHLATPEQKKAGVIDQPENWRRDLSELLTFDNLPDRQEIAMRARAIVEFVRDNAPFNTWKGEKAVMIGGAPWLMPELERQLESFGYRPVYAFSKREIVETHNADGTVTKKAVFKHLGFISAM